MEHDSDLSSLPDCELLESTRACALRGREDLVRLLRRLAEVKRRRLYEKRYSSLFVFCVRELGFSEPEAQRRSVVAAAGLQYPILFRRLGSGILNLTTAAKVSKHLTPENANGLISRCAGKTFIEVERILASLAPAPPPRDRVRFLGSHAGGNRAPAQNPKTPQTTPPARPDSDEKDRVPADRKEAQFDLRLNNEGSPPTTDRVRGEELVEIKFAAHRDLFERLERARALLRNKYPVARFEQVIGDALDALLEKIDPAQRAERRRRREIQRSDKGRASPSPHETRHSGPGASITPMEPGTPGLRPVRASAPLGREAAATRPPIPRAVRDAVWTRDDGACAFVDETGVRCGAKEFLEIDHIVPLAKGGRSDDPSALRLLCRTHNLAEARRIFGDEHMERFTTGKRPVRRALF